MEKIKEIHLSDLANDLNKTHVKLNLEFLRTLLINLSNNKKPWYDTKFLKKNFLYNYLFFKTPIFGQYILIGQREHHGEIVIQIF